MDQNQNQTKVTTAALLRMKRGESKTFTLPDVADIYTGKSIAYRAGRLAGCRYECKSDFPAKTLTITKV